MRELRLPEARSRLWGVADELLHRNKSRLSAADTQTNPNNRPLEAASSQAGRLPRGAQEGGGGWPRRLGCSEAPSGNRGGGRCTPVPAPGRPIPCQFLATPPPVSPGPAGASAACSHPVTQTVTPSPGWQPQPLHPTLRLWSVYPLPTCHPEVAAQKRNSHRKQLGVWRCHTSTGPSGSGGPVGDCPAMTLSGARTWSTELTGSGPFSEARGTPRTQRLLSAPTSGRGRAVARPWRRTPWAHRDPRYEQKALGPPSLPPHVPAEGSQLDPVGRDWQ